MTVATFDSKTRAFIMVDTLKLGTDGGAIRGASTFGGRRAGKKHPGRLRDPNSRVGGDGPNPCPLPGAGRGTTSALPTPWGNDFGPSNPVGEQLRPCQPRGGATSALSTPWGSDFGPVNPWGNDFGPVSPTGERLSSGEDLSPLTLGEG